MKALAHFPMTLPRRTASVPASRAVAMVVVSSLQAAWLSSCTCMQAVAGKGNRQGNRGTASGKSNIRSIIRGLRPQVAGG